MTVTIGTETFHLRASLGAWRKFERNTGIRIAAIDQNDVTVIAELLYYFAEAGAKAEGGEFDYDVDSFLDLCEVSELPKLSEAVSTLLGGDAQKKSGAKASR